MILDEDVQIDPQMNWTETQSFLREASILALSRSHWTAAVRCSDPEEQTVLAESRDGGASFFVLPLSDTRFLAATRVDGGIARQFAGAPAIEVSKGAGGETDEAVVLMESHDGSVTWSGSRTFLGRHQTAN